MHGVNFDVLERRDPEIYGGIALTELENRIKHWARELDLEAMFFQSNSEGEFVEHLHRLPETADAVDRQRRRLDPLQPSDRATRWSSHALPAVEVHISDVESREDWRRIPRSSRES